MLAAEADSGAMAAAGSPDTAAEAFRSDSEEETTSVDSDSSIDTDSDVDDGFQVPLLGSPGHCPEACRLVQPPAPRGISCRWTVWLKTAGAQTRAEPDCFVGW